jgi:hypothetical protein
MLIYRLDDKKWTLAFGTYPVLTLSEARRKRDEARKKIAVAVDANDVKKSGEAHETSQLERAKLDLRRYHRFRRKRNSAIAGLRSARAGPRENRALQFQD